MTLDTSARLQIICFEFLLFMVLFKAFACKYKFAFVREKNKLLSKSISWSIEPKYALKKTVKGSQVGAHYPNIVVEPH